MLEIRKAKDFLLPKLHHLLQFLMKQGLAMVGNLLYGFLCVRMLPLPEYAKFAVLFGFMGSLTVLLDIGISGTLAPLVGEEINNLQLIANYVASIRKIALKLYMIVAPVAILVFFLLTQKQGWGIWVIVQMLVVLLVTAWFARVSSSYGAVLLLRRDRSRYYRAQMIGSLGSLALLLIFWALHRMNIYVGILLNVAQIIYIATTYFRRARQLLVIQGTPSAQQEKAIVRLAMPNFPSTIFYAIQGQITLMLITAFGHNAISVANVGALGRIGQILMFLAQMNPILVEPYFARLQASRLRRMYLLAVILIVTFASAICGLAFLFPELFLWVLGPKYSSLRVEVGLMVLGSAINYVGGFIWVVNSSRRFVYWWSNLTNIILTILVQVGLILNLDLSTVRNVLLFQIATAGVGLCINSLCGIYGFWRGPQKMERGTAG